MLTHGSLFAGIGGFDLGFQWAGIETIWQVEIDEYCRQVLARHFLEAERFSDIRDCGAHNLKTVDVISGGFPCQDISVAGKQSGITGPRSGLWSEMHRIIGELRPRFAVIENVPNLAKLGLDRVLADLASIGYDAEWQCISANDVGAPHLRRRIWIVAYPNNPSQHKEKIKPTETRINAQRRLGRFHSVAANTDYNGTSERQKEIISQRTIDQVQEQSGGGGGGKVMRGGEASANPGSKRIQRGWEETISWLKTLSWSEDGGGLEGEPRGRNIPKPTICRIDDGIQARLYGLGNAIVPQIAEIIGRRLMEIEL